MPGWGAAVWDFRFGRFDRTHCVCATFVARLCRRGFSVLELSSGTDIHGDAGSGFLGITLGILSLQAAWSAPQLFWSWLILLGVFIVDATVTLLRRLLRGDRLYEAHRSHAYQYASRHFGRHLPVTLGLGQSTCCGCYPRALGRCRGLDGLAGVLIAYLPLVLLTIKFRAGQLERDCAARQ